MRYPLSLAIILLLVAQQTSAQDNESIFDKIANLPVKVFNKIDNKEAELEKQLDQQTVKALQSLQRREAKLNKEISKKDSTTATQLFAGSNARYEMLEANINQPVTQSSATLKEYLPKLDSL